MAGSSEDLPVIEALLLLLPSTAYGQVLVETPIGFSLPPLAAPSRVTVTRLERTVDAAPGDPLAAAVHGWLAEWIPDEPDPGRAVTLWVGCSARDRVDPSGATVQSL